MGLKLIFLLVLTSSAAAAKTLTVPVFYWSSKIEAQVAMRKGLEEEIQRFNKSGTDKIELRPYVAGEGRQGILNQLNQLEEALRSKPDALIIQPTDISIPSKALQEANDRNIPVFTFDQFILHGRITSYIASDNYQAGWDNGIYIADMFPKNQDLRIVIYEYPIVSAVISRVDGFFDALRSRHRKFVVLKRYIAVDPQSGKEQTDQFLIDFPKKKSVDVLFTTNDGAGLTTVKMLWDKGRREIVHASVDGDPESIENIKSKRLTVIDSAQFCAEMGRETARQLIAHFEGNRTLEKKLIPTFPITDSTLKSFNGWMGSPMAPPKEFSDLALSKALSIKTQSSTNH